MNPGNEPTIYTEIPTPESRQPDPPPIKHGRKFVYDCLILAIVVALVATGTYVYKQYHHKHLVTPSNTKVVSFFSFGGVQGWWQGATNKTSMAVFQDHGDCFTSGQYNTGTVNVTAEFTKYAVGLTGSGYAVARNPAQTLVVQTNLGKQQYQLQQYIVSGSGSAETIDGGQEIGYLQLSGGYLKFEGDCTTANELPATIPALEAITFSKSN